MTPRASTRGVLFSRWENDDRDTTERWQRYNRCNLVVISVIDARSAKEVIKVSTRQKQVKVRSKPDAVQVSEGLPYTEEEIRVARLSVEGLSDAEIAGVLGMTQEAVRTLRDIITAKARAMNRGC
jgi:DNA-binding CsgD family transcriptional regulator